MARARKICSQWTRKHFGIEATYRLYLDNYSAVVVCDYRNVEGGKPKINGWEYIVWRKDLDEVESKRLYKTPIEAMAEAEKALLKIMDDFIAPALDEKAELSAALNKKKFTKGLIK